jgi:hypothetical protein
MGSGRRRGAVVLGSMLRAHHLWLGAIRRVGCVCVCCEFEPCRTYFKVLVFPLSLLCVHVSLSPIVCTVLHFFKVAQYHLNLSSMVLISVGIE